MNQVNKNNNSRNVIIINYPNSGNTIGDSVVDDEYEVDYDDDNDDDMNNRIDNDDDHLLINEDDFLISSKDCLSYYMPVLTNKLNHPLESTNLSNDVSCLTNNTNNNNNHNGNLVNNVNTVTNSKRHQEKYHVLKEILSSEKKYLNDLREIVEVGIIYLMYIFGFYD